MHHLATIMANNFEKLPRIPDTQNEEKQRYIEKLDADAKKRLDYLLDQAEIYTHFLTNGKASNSIDENRSKQRYVLSVPLFSREMVTIDFKVVHISFKSTDSQQ